MKISQLFKRLGKGTKLGIAVFGTLLVLGVPLAVKAGYGPDRPRLYDWNNPADRPGANEPTLNSFINTPTYGDERNFTRIAPVVAGQEPEDADYSQENVNAEVNKEYWVRVFVHNNANDTLNNDANKTGVADNVRVRMEIADGLANGVDVMGHITADDTTPKHVWDTGTLVNSNQKFAVKYQPGTAEIVNQANKSGLKLSDAIVSQDGVQIGYDSMNGELPGCFQFSAYVFVKVKVLAPQMEIQKTTRQVRTLPDGKKEGVGDWTDTLKVKPGDLISWQLAVKNTHPDLDAENVTIRDNIPAGLTLEPGSIVYRSSAAANKPVPDTGLGSGGANVGPFKPSGNGSIFFRTVVGQPQNNTCEIVNTAYVRGDNIPETSDGAKIVYDESVCKPNVARYECSLLEMTQDKDNPRKVTFKVTTSQDSTTKVTSYVIDFGDGSAALTTNQNPYTYTYSKDGNYTAVAKVNFTLADGSVKEKVAADKCIVGVAVNVPKPPVTTTAAALPKTGAGSMLGIFGAVSALGAFLHRSFVLRRN